MDGFGLSHGGRAVPGFGLGAQYCTHCEENPNTQQTQCWTEDCSTPHPGGPGTPIGRSFTPARAGVGVAAPYGLGAAGGSTTSPAAVGFAAALGGVVGFATGALIGSEFGTGPAMVRRAGGGALIGMIVGSFTGAAVMAPSTSSQGT